MDEVVFQIVVAVLVAGRPNIRLPVEEPELVVGQEGQDPDVEFSLVEEEGVLYVFLDYPATPRRLSVDEVHYFIHVLEYLNTPPLVEVLRFDYPNVLQIHSPRQI